LIEKSHNKQSFLAQDAITYNFHLIYNGQDRMKAKVTLSADSQNGLFELSDGNKMYFNKDKVFVSPALDESKKTRFNAYTWS
jgi:hypothetical protein